MAKGLKSMSLQMVKVTTSSIEGLGFEISQQKNAQT